MITTVSAYTLKAVVVILVIAGVIFAGISSLTPPAVVSAGAPAE